MGIKNADSTSLKVDGIYGPKTDAVNNDFENNFLDGITGGKNTHKTVQTKTFPQMPKLTDAQILNAQQNKYLINMGNDNTWFEIPQYLLEQIADEKLPTASEYIASQ